MNCIGPWVRSPRLDETESLLIETANLLCLLLGVEPPFGRGVGPISSPRISLFLDFLSVGRLRAATRTLPAIAGNPGRVPSLRHEGNNRDRRYEVSLKPKRQESLLGA